MICTLDIDMQGVRSMKKTDLNPVYVLIKPPSLEILVSRFTTLLLHNICTYRFIHRPVIVCVQC